MGLGSEIQDPGSGKNLLRIQGSKRHQITDPGSGSVALILKMRMRSSLVRMRSSLVRMSSSLERMRSSLVVRASDCQCTSCNGPGSQHPVGTVESEGRQMKQC
jgi:hypothetical protein